MTSRLVYREGPSIISRPSNTGNVKTVYSTTTPVTTQTVVTIVGLSFYFKNFPDTIN